MSKGSSRSMYGGSGGKGSRVSVASLEGLRSAMRSDSAEKSHGSSSPTFQPAQDDKKTMMGLNGRLSGYLERVNKLDKENKDLEEQIQDILNKRGDPNARDWDEVKKPLDDLKKKLHDKTLEKVGLLQEIDNAKLSSDDLKNKLNNEKQANKVLENDVNNVKKMIDNNNLNRMQLEDQIKSAKEELASLKKEHQDEVNDMCTKIKECNVLVEFDSKENNLSDALKKMRNQYAKLAEENLKDTDDWYKKKIESIKREVVQNTEVVQSGKSELKNLQKEKQGLENDIQAMENMIRTLEQTLNETNGRYNNDLTRLNKILKKLEAELGRLKTQVERQVDDYQELLYTTRALEVDIKKYHHLIQSIVPDDSATPAR